MSTHSLKWLIKTTQAELNTPSSKHISLDRTEKQEEQVLSIIKVIGRLLEINYKFVCVSCKPVLKQAISHIKQLL
jgi:hypothetical protein